MLTPGPTPLAVKTMHKIFTVFYFSERRVASKFTLAPIPSKLQGQLKI